MPFHPKTNTYFTTCEECGTRHILTTIDGDGILIGDECPKCGYYTTRYMPGQEVI